MTEYWVKMIVKLNAKEDDIDIAEKDIREWIRDHIENPWDINIEVKPVKE